MIKIDKTWRLFLIAQVFFPEKRSISPSTHDSILCYEVKIPHSLMYVLFPRHWLSSTLSSIQFPFVYHFFFHSSKISEPLLQLSFLNYFCDCFFHFHDCSNFGVCILSPNYLPPCRLLPKIHLNCIQLS